MMSVRRRRRGCASGASSLAAHVRNTVWGPAEFVGSPPRWLVAEGFLLGIVGVVAIVGVSLFGAWTGRPLLSGGEASLVCAAALAVYLMCVRAGRALVGITALLATVLAVRAPQAAAGVVLESRGQVESVVVTAVEQGRAVDGGRGRYLCTVADARGVPLEVPIWRGCEPTSRPGDVMSVVYDPEGTVSPRGVRREAWGPWGEVAPWAAALVGVCVVAVVRSMRMSGSADASRPMG
ncbi:hypothetical protein ABZ589_06940 [Streptomyces sp. NPDC013313]|uniref:hypothetical protein n=1 Tax=Streptomyces sp. NPDC013313 TaxID=3155603 RepID=UPI0033C6830C